MHFSLSLIALSAVTVSAEQLSTSTILTNTYNSIYSKINSIQSLSNSYATSSNQASVGAQIQENLNFISDSVNKAAASLPPKSTDSAVDVNSLANVVPAVVPFSVAMASLTDNAQRFAVAFPALSRMVRNHGMNTHKSFISLANAGGFTGMDLAVAELPIVTGNNTMAATPAGNATEPAPLTISQITNLLSALGGIDGGLPNSTETLASSGLVSKLPIVGSLVHVLGNTPTVGQLVTLLQSLLQSSSAKADGTSGLTGVLDSLPLVKALLGSKGLLGGVGGTLGAVTGTLGLDPVLDGLSPVVSGLTGSLANLLHSLLGI